MKIVNMVLNYIRRFGQWWLQQFKGTSALGKVVFGGVSLLFACCICTVPIALVSSENSTLTPEATSEIPLASNESLTDSQESDDGVIETPLATQTQVPLPTNTPSAIPTNTSLPTRTSTPTYVPTDTSEPLETATPFITATLESTDTPQPTATQDMTATTEAEEQAYLIEMTQIGDDYVTALELVGELSNQAGEDPTLLFDEEWKTQMAIGLLLMQVSGENSRELQPPARYEEAHKQFLEAVVHMDRVVELLPRGIDELDADLINEASIEMLLGTEALDEATAAFERANNVP